MVIILGGCGRGSQDGAQRDAGQGADDRTNRGVGILNGRKRMNANMMIIGNSINEEIASVTADGQGEAIRPYAILFLKNLKLREQGSTDDNPYFT